MCLSLSAAFQVYKANKSQRYLRCPKGFATRLTQPTLTTTNTTRHNAKERKDPYFLSPSTPASLFPGHDLKESPADHKSQHKHQGNEDAKQDACLTVPA